MAYVGPEDPDKGSELAAPKARRSSRREIGIVLFEGFSLLTVVLIPEVFQLANELFNPGPSADSQYKVRILSVMGGDVACSSSISIWTHPCDVHSPADFDVLFIAGGEGALHATQDERLITWLRNALSLCGIVDSFGEGSVLLETARYGAPVSSHSVHGRRGGHGWVRDNKSADEDERYEPAKTALMLVARDLGGKVARDVATRLALSASLLASMLPARSAATAAEKARASAQWLKENCHLPISVSDAARVAAMSERNFLRCFKQELGVTPSEFLLQARLEMTSRLLAETDLPIDKIARQCGWVNGDRVAKIFRKRFALTPSAFRARARSQMSSEIS